MEVGVQFRREAQENTQGIPPFFGPLPRLSHVIVGNKLLCLGLEPVGWPPPITSQAPKTGYEKDELGDAAAPGVLDAWKQEVRTKSAWKTQIAAQGVHSILKGLMHPEDRLFDSTQRVVGIYFVADST